MKAKEWGFQSSPGGMQLAGPPQGLTSSSLSLPRVSIWLLRVLSIMDSFSMRMSYLLLLKEIPASHLLVTQDQLTFRDDSSCPKLQ